MTQAEIADLDAEAIAVLYGDDPDDGGSAPAASYEQVFRAVRRARGQSEEAIDAAWRARDAGDARNGRSRPR